MDNSSFFSKIEKLKNNLDSSQLQVEIDRDIKLELLMFLKSQIDTITQKNSLKSTISNIIYKRVVDGENSEDEDKKISNSILIKLLDILMKSENESIDSILSVLKQQIVIQQNNTLNAPPTNSSQKNQIDDGITREEYHDLKNKYDNLLQNKSAEFTEAEFRTVDD
jgi:hypothetical protein